MDHLFYLNVAYLQITLALLNLDAKFGIGNKKSVMNALLDGISNKVNVLSFHLTVNQVMLLLDNV